ncbi:MAG: GNAT family N-acetyltransferase [Rhodobacteraceae bacterium]|nr:GNAT family N-acetyltransferase [Paracoccaceae bacterium]
MTLHIPTLETERLILRAQRVEDFEPFAAFLGSERARHTGGPVTNRLQAWRGFAHVAGQWLLRGYSSFVMEAKATGEPIGLVGPWMPETWPEPEIGWSLWSAEAEGKGLAFEGARASLDYAFGALGWTTAVSYIERGNAGSIALAKRLGAVRDDAAAFPPDNEEPPLVYRHNAGGHA